MSSMSFLFFFFFNDTATTEIYTLSLHDALPISPRRLRMKSTAVPKSRSAVSVRTIGSFCSGGNAIAGGRVDLPYPRDRKSTRLKSSHLVISYAVFFLKQKIKDGIIIKMIITIAW